MLFISKAFQYISSKFGYVRAFHSDKYITVVVAVAAAAIAINVFQFYILNGS
jgi:hypothetical protein